VASAGDWVGDDACCGFGGFGGQRAALEVIARSQTAPHREVQRAQVLLFAAEGLANARINTRVGVSPATVRAWRARFAQEGLAKLGTVRHGRGRKSTIPQAKIDGIVELTRHSKPGGADPLVVRDDGATGRGVPQRGHSGYGRPAG